MDYKIINIDEKTDENIILKVKDIKCKKLEPILELYKGKLFSYLIKLFISDCINEFGKHIFTIKKSYNRTLTNLFSSWIFSLYINYDFSGDFFLPSNYENTDSLEYTLNDLCKYDKNIKNPKERINKVITKLKTNYKQQLNMLGNYENSSLFLNNCNKYKIKKTKILNKNITFLKLQITVDFIIKDKRLQNILNNILIPCKIYDKLFDIYTGPENNIDEYIWAMVYRYQLLSSNNHQLAVLPTIMASMKKDYSLNFECFASGINNTFNHYCSLYYDIERYFGSVGSFFNIEPIKGTFGFNPPYQKDIIILGIERVLKFLEKSKENLTFIITIPIWDNVGRHIMKELYNNELEKQNIDYGDFEIIYKIKDSQYYRTMRMIQKEKFTYIDHNFDLYKNKTIQNTYVFILSNQDIKEKPLEEYDFETFIKNTE